MFYWNRFNEKILNHSLYLRCAVAFLPSFFFLVFFCACQRNKNYEMGSSLSSFLYYTTRSSGNGKHKAILCAMLTLNVIWKNKFLEKFHVAFCMTIIIFIAGWFQWQKKNEWNIKRKTFMKGFTRKFFPSNSGVHFTPTNPGYPL